MWPRLATSALLCRLGDKVTCELPPVSLGARKHWASLLTMHTAPALWLHASSLTTELLATCGHLPATCPPTGMLMPQDRSSVSTGNQVRW